MTLLAAGTTSTLGIPCESSITGTDYGALRLDYGYAAGNNGNVASQTIWTGGTQLETQSYSYDELNRLKTAVAGGWRQTYVFDRYGNRALLSGTVNGNYVPDQPGAAQVATDSSAQVEAQFVSNRWSGATVDPAGNGNVTQPATGAFPQLTYDGENRIVSAVTGPGGTMSFGYDGEGRRVTKTVGAVTTTYVHDALGRVAAECGGVAETSGLQYVTVDHLGSTRLVTDAAGAVVKRHDYLPFGQELPVDKGGRTSGMKYQELGFQDPQRVKFTGKERDAETGLDYFGARYFSGAQGRFTTPDPFNLVDELVGQEFDDYLANPQYWNKYAYSLNNPLKYKDSDGALPHAVVGGLVGGGIGGALELYSQIRSGQDLNWAKVATKTGAGAAVGATAAATFGTSLLFQGFALSVAATGSGIADRALDNDASTQALDYTSIGADAVVGAVSGIVGGVVGKQVQGAVQTSGQKVNERLADQAVRATAQRSASRRRGARVAEAGDGAPGESGTTCRRAWRAAAKAGTTAGTQKAIEILRKRKNEENHQ